MIDVGKLDAEVAEMEKAIFGEDVTDGHPDQKGPENMEGPENPHTPDTLEAQDSDVVDEPTVSDEKPKQRVSWKKRYQDLQSYTDSSMYEMKKELTDMKEQLLFARQEAQQAKAEEKRSRTKLSDLLSQEDKEMLGEDTVTSLSSATEKVIDESVNPLKAELERERKLRMEAEKKAIENERRTEYGSFEEQLGNLVPDFRDMNANQGFIKWLQGKDNYSPHSRITLLRNAERTRDAKRVAEFFNEYKALTSPNQDELMAQVAPNSTPTAATPKKANEKKRWTEGEIQKVMEGIRSGRYTHEKIQSLMDEIEDAYLEGRVS